jgi:excinuclease ABC subunit B
MSPEQLRKKLKHLEEQMYKHAQNLEFEAAARLRDEIQHIQNIAFGAEAV